MAKRQLPCPNCGAGAVYAAYVMPDRTTKLGFHCLPCGTVTERFGILDVITNVPAQSGTEEVEAA